MLYRRILLTAKEKAKDARLRREFHTTLAQYKKIAGFQNCRCGMCKRPASDFKNGLALDHDHKTGLVRGLLCHICNRRLGKFLDNDALLLAAAAYVTNPPAVAALGIEILTATGRIGTIVRRKRLVEMSGIHAKSKTRRKTQRKVKSIRVVRSKSPSF